MTLGEVSGIIALAWLIFEKGLKPIREISPAWIRAGMQTAEWPECYACRSSGERGRQEPKCLTCGGTGRTYPGFWWRCRKTLKSFLTETH